MATFKAKELVMNLIDRRSVFVPLYLMDEVCRIADVLGLRYCGGMYDAENNQKVLYLN